MSKKLVKILSVGIGSTRGEIEHAYKSSKRIKDLTNENDIGFVDGFLRVEFSFSADNAVTQMRIYK